MADKPDADLERRLAALETRVAELEAERAVQASAPAGAVPPPPTGAPVPPPPAGQPTWPRSDVPLWQAPQAARERAATWTEQITTEVALKWAGLGLLFLAAVFLVSTAVSRGWIGPELQLAGAIALGLALVGLGVRFVSGFPRWAQSFAVAGTAILFTSAGAANEWLDLGGIGTGALATIAVAALGIAHARQFTWLAMAFLTFFGSLFVMGWIGAPDEYGNVAIMAYTFGLAVIFHALYVDRNWPVLYLVTGVVLMLTQLGVPIDRDDFAGDGFTAVQVFLVATAIVHWVAPVFYQLWHRSTDELGRIAARVLLAVPAWFWFGTVVLHDMDTGPAAVLAAAVASIAVASALILRSTVPLWLWAAQLLAASVAISVGLMFWLEGSTLLAALAVQAAAMLVLATKLEDTWFWWQSVLTAAAVGLVTLGLTIDAIENDETWGGDAVHLLVFAVAFGIGWYERKNDVGKAVALGAYLGLMVWVASVFIHFGQGQLIISAVWAAIGVAVVVAGLSHQNMMVARVGLVTLVAVVLKLLTVDLAEVDTFWRAGLFFVIGLGFLWLSYSVPGLVGRGEQTTETE